MYGLVNKAVRDLIVDNFDEAKWEEIADSVGVDHHFISMENYNDSVTYDLVGAASKLLDLPAEQILTQFGSHWIRFTATEGYGHLFTLFGDTLEEFLDGLGNDLHARVALTMPDLKPPEFKIEKLAENRFHVHYMSHRKGLTPMVKGLLEGLTERFGEPSKVTHLRTEPDEALTHEVFEIELLGH